MRDSSASRGARAHGGDVADVDGERLVADVGGRREAAVEVHALDERVGGQHLQRSAVDVATAASSPMPTTSEAGGGGSRRRM